VDPSQPISPEGEKIARRLREERVRVEPHQGRFAAKIGLNQKRQSFLENGERELRGEYLALIASVGLDVGFIITGQRSAGDLTREETNLLDSFRDLASDDRAALTHLALRLSGKTSTGPRD
jgi:transcriptional regulator with XRE-family HTH domain